LGLGHIPPPTWQTVPGGGGESPISPEIHAKSNYELYPKKKIQFLSVYI